MKTATVSPLRLRLMAWSDQLGMTTGHRRRLIGLVGLSVALLSALMSALSFLSPDSNSSGWFYHLTAVGLLIAAAYLLFPSQWSLPAMRREVVIAAVLILLLGATARLYHLDTDPLGTWIDEADNGFSARQMLQDPNFRPVYIPSTHLPAHFIYLIALTMQVVGGSTLAVRLVSAAFGIGCVVMAFLVGREAHGSRMGLMYAFLFAASHWAINFSRFGLHGISTPFFILLTLYWLVRARKTGALHHYMWAGLTFGFGLCFYAAYRSFAIVPVVYFVYVGIETLRKRVKAQTNQLILNMAVFGIATLAAFAPVAQYAAMHWTDFWSRTEQVSIFGNRDQKDLGQAILANTARHLLMFNQIGDRNGRHNLSGEPMLDPVTGSLFVLGLALALSRPRDLLRLLMLLTFAVGLMGGILSLDWEAPQSLRAIATMVPAFYFAALAVESLWQWLAGQKNNLFQIAGAGATLAGAVYVGAYNYDIYFNQQMNRAETWEAFNSVETLTARHMRELGVDKTTFYVSMYFNNHLVIRFIAPEVQDSRTMVPPDGLPVHEPGDKPVAIFADHEMTWLVDQVAQFYPTARVYEDLRPDGAVGLYTISIPPEDIQGAQGLTANYWAGDSTDGAPALTRTEKMIEADWPGGAPLPTPFTAQWTGILYAPVYGDYELHLTAPGEATLWLDDRQVMAGSGAQAATLKLAMGNHVLRVEAAGGEGQMQLQWRPAVTGGGLGDLVPIAPQWLTLSPPGNNNGLYGKYYPNENWSGEPSLERIDSFINMYFHIIPLNRPYSTDWTGQINILQSGDWTFGLQINGHAQVFIDNELVIDAPEPTNEIQNTVSLTEGWHAIQIKYIDNVGGSSIRLYWVPPGGSREYVPSSALRPY